ncbi:MAG: hypothetical protein E7322_04650 [Clostridiales bacterium]|nr:hypothetical protein [Clostridiales bacterium]
MKKKIFQKYMTRPLVYMTITRLMTALIFLLAVTKFLNTRVTNSAVSGFLAALFALFAYLVYLRMDGLRIPRMKYFKSKKKKEPVITQSSMTDHLDDDAPVTFDELEEDERDWISFVSSAVNFVIFTVLSFII